MTLDKTELLFQKMLIQGPCEAVEGPGRLSRRLSGKLGWEVLGAWISGCLWLTVGILRRQGLNSEGGGEGGASAFSQIPPGAVSSRVKVKWRRSESGEGRIHPSNLYVVQ